MKIKNKIVGCTGHRQLSHSPESIKTKIKDFLIEINPTEACTGMAQGFDTLFAQVCLELGIPFIAMVPFPEQARLWPKTDQEIYMDLLSNAKEIRIFSQDIKNKYEMYGAFFGRNRWIVDYSTNILSYFKEGSSGGTAHAVEYAEKQNVPIFNIF